MIVEKNSMIQIYELSAGRCSLSTPAFLAQAMPVLSWKVKTDEKDWMQLSYEVEQYDASGEKVATTGVVASSDSVGIPWPFEPFASRERRSIRVRVTDEDGQWSGWSDSLYLEAPLFEPSDWSSSFITSQGNETDSCTYLRREFSSSGEILSARLYITALGLYHVRINGKTVSDDCFSPGWTVYSDRLLYQSYDVSSLLVKGENAICAILAEGWYSGRLGFDGGKRNIWGERLALSGQLEITYADGHSEKIISDSEWRSSAGPLKFSSIYDGELFDARDTMLGWDLPGFDQSSWERVQEIPFSNELLTPADKPPVRRIEEIAPVCFVLSPSGKQLIDFGQNLVGRLSIRVRGEKGHAITFRHAEVLEKGELGVRPLRLAKATDTYILQGTGEYEEWEPLFTFHGFRYVEVENWPSEINKEDITAVVLHSDMKRTGWFSCSDPLLNRLHENVLWSMKGNFLEIPTDCPQRDERLGWTGDLQVFSPTASFFFDVTDFLSSWLKDLSIEQKKNNGIVPPVVPNALGDTFGAAAWGDAATVTPSVLYERYGRRGILASQFDSMKSWVDFIISSAGEDSLWNSGFQFGDWLDPTAPPDKPWLAQTAKEIVASAYFARSSSLLAQAAALLCMEEASYYKDIARKSRTAFQREYITPSGRMMSDSQTAYSLAIVFDLFENEEQKRKAGNRLASLVRDSGYVIQTGFVGTPLICDALSMTGNYVTAYRLLKQEESPSWLYPVIMGGTTIWERWDSMLPDGTINSGEMTSFNHYALGAVADWMHRVIGGLAPAAPGYKHIRIAPHPGGNITSAMSEHESPYGRIHVSWDIKEGMFNVNVIIPPNTRAEILLPSQIEKEFIEVGSGEYSWSVPYVDPDARGPYTVDDLIGEVLGDTKAKGALMKVLDELNVPPFIYAVMNNERGNSVSSLLQMVHASAEAVQKMNSAFAEAADR